MLAVMNYSIKMCWFENRSILSIKTLSVQKESAKKIVGVNLSEIAKRAGLNKGVYVGFFDIHE